MKQTDKQWDCDDNKRFAVCRWFHSDRYAAFLENRDISQKNFIVQSLKRYQKDHSYYKQHKQTVTYITISRRAR